MQEGPSEVNGGLLLSTAPPTSPASDQTKGGGRSVVQRTPRFGADPPRGTSGGKELTTTTLLLLRLLLSLQLQPTALPLTSSHLT